MKSWRSPATAFRWSTDPPALVQGSEDAEQCRTDVERQRGETRPHSAEFQQSAEIGAAQQSAEVESAEQSAEVEGDGEGEPKTAKGR